MLSHSRPALTGIAFSFALMGHLRSQDLSPSAATLLGADPWSTSLSQATERDGRWWASGPDYKVAFDDGVEFFPLLGARAAEHKPLRWRTESVRIGGQTWIAAQKPTVHVQPKRFELDWNGVVEAYDLRADGVEQRFVLNQAPSMSGDLEICGRIETPLCATRSESQVGAIVFCDDLGNAILSYGAATVIDADGRYAPAETSYDGTQILIRVAAAWLEHATYPLVVDPLLARSPLFSGPDSVSFPNVARNDVQNHLLVTYGRQHTSTDYDFFSRILTDDFVAVAEVWGDLSDLISTRYGQAAYVRGASRWVIVLGVSTSLENWVEVRFRDAASTINDVGNIVVVPRISSSYHAIEPQVSGTTSASQDQCLLVYERDYSVGGYTSTDTTRIVAHVINAATESIGSPFFVRNAGPSSYDSSSPNISFDSANDGWMVVWEERTNSAGQPWRVMGNRVYPDASLATTSTVGNVPSSITIHKMRPKVAGSGGRYAVLYTTRNNLGEVNPGRNGNVLRCQRLDWNQGDATPTMVINRTIAGSQSEDFMLATYGRSIAYDHETDSHWGIVYADDANNQILAGRWGYQLELLERVVVETDGNGDSYYSPSITFDDDQNSFPVVYCEVATGTSRVVGRKLTHPNTAVTAIYGTACGGVLSTYNRSSAQPLAGSEFFQMRVSGAAGNAPTWLLAAVSPANIALPGHPCPLLLNPVPTLIPVAYQFSAANGSTVWDLPLPADGIGVDIHWQALQTVGLTIQTTNGLRTNIR